MRISILRKRFAGWSFLPFGTSQSPGGYPGAALFSSIVIFYDKKNAVPGWRNGIRNGLKIRGREA